MSATDRLAPGRARRFPGSPRGGARRWAAAVVAATTLAGGRARAEADGVYGRFAGDLELGASAGAELGAERARAATRVTLHYFDTAGIAVGYLEPFGEEHPTGRALTVGTDLRPLFLPRWSNGLARGPARLDLAIDSLSLGFAAFFASGPQGPLGRSRGIEASLGVGMPLATRAAGPWIEARGALSWVDGGLAPSPPARAAGYLLFAWHWRLESSLLPRR